MNMSGNLDDEWEKKMRGIKKPGIEDEEDLPVIEEGEEGTTIEEDGGQEMGMYDEKEEEARQEIQDMFGELVEELDKVQQSLEEVMEAKTCFVAGKYRIEVTEVTLNGISKMSMLNKLMSESNFFLKYYVDLQEDIRFDNIKNLIFKFQEALMKEQARRFAIIKRRGGEFYITKGIVDYYIKGIHAWLSRLIGALKQSGDYIVVVPPQRSMGNVGGTMGPDGNMVNESSGDITYPEEAGYANSYPWWKQGSGANYVRQGSRVRPRKMRDFGDAET